LLRFEAANYLERFPNSTQVMNLYSRFTAVVLSDRDYAKELSETAKDNEYAAKKMNKDGGAVEADNHSEVSYGSGDDKSQGSSAAADRAKAALLLKKKREAMEERLDAPIKSFMRNSNTFTFIFCLLMAASTSLSYIQIFQTDDSMSLFNMKLY
jgi:spore coat protein CotH